MIYNKLLKIYPILMNLGKNFGNNYWIKFNKICK